MNRECPPSASTSNSRAAPTIAPARGPPQGDLLIDQTPAFDPPHGEPVPEFVYDQPLPNDFDD